MKRSGMRKGAEGGVYMPTLYISKELHALFESEWKRLCDHFGVRVSKAEFMRKVVAAGLVLVGRDMDEMENPICENCGFSEDECACDHETREDRAAAEEEFGS